MTSNNKNYKIVNEIVSTRRPGATSVCFFAVNVNDEYRKPEFKIKREG